MPTYDYQCRSCGVITEVVHSMLDDGPTTCERCGGELRHVIHPTGIIFKGGGFYKTDSRSSSSPSSVGGSSGGGSGDGSGPATSTTEKAKGDAGSTPKPSGSGAGKSEGGGD